MRERSLFFVCLPRNLHMGAKRLQNLVGKLGSVDVRKEGWFVALKLADQIIGDLIMIDGGKSVWSL